MANSPQAKYRAERADRVRDRKSRQLSTFRTAIKKLRKAITESSAADTLNSLLRSTISIIDGAASKGLIHSNRANRLKSRLNSSVKKAAA